MPITYEVDEDQNFAYVTVSGKVTEDDLIEHASRFLTDPRVKPGFRELFDARAATPEDLTASLVEVLLQLDHEHHEKTVGSRTALVVPLGPEAELADAFENEAEGNVIVFFNVDVAKTWLGYTGSLGTAAAAQ